MNDQSWQECPAGEIQSMVQQMRARTNRRTMLASVAAGLICLLLVIVAVQLTGRNPGSAPIPISITCTKCMELFEQYANGSLGKEQIQQVDHHLDSCPSCRLKYKDKGHVGPRAGIRTTKPAVS